MLRRTNSCLERIETQYPEPCEKILGGVEESEVVEELVQILVDCVKEVDVRGQEILLRKFFYEIEKEISLQRFLAQRLKQSKISSLFDNIPPPEMEITTRELNVSVSEKLDRFKVKTVQVGVVVKEENATS